MNFSGEEITKFMLGSVLIFGVGGFLAMAIAGLSKYILDLEEIFGGLKRGQIYFWRMAIAE